MLRALSSRRFPQPLALLVSLALALFWVVAVPLAPADAVGSTGGFEIDGDKPDSPAGGPVDWGTPPASLETVSDPIGATDTTVYSNGSKEDTPSSWTVNESAGAPSAGDIGKSYLANGYVDGSFWLYYAFDRADSNGSIAYSLELNQLSNTTNAQGVEVPQRSTGDLLFSIEQQGSGAFTVTALLRWESGTWKTYTIPAAAFDYDVSQDKTFVEFAFNLSTILKPVLGDIECGDLAFSELWLRSRSSQSMSSELKDFATGSIALDSCAGLSIKKVDGSGKALPGATFTIAPNPLPGQSSGSLVVTDGGSSDADGSANGTVSLPRVNAGTYTVTETAPPGGYLIDSAAGQQVTVAPTQDKTLRFTNSLGSVAFTKTYAGAAPSTGATFRLDRTHRWDFATSPAALVAGSFESVTVVDNGLGDDDPALGAISVQGLKSGQWTITETAAPTGWAVDPGVETFEIGPGVDEAAGTFISTGAFDDPLLTAGLTVVKTESSVGHPAPLRDVVFDLFLDDGDGVAEVGDQDVLVDSRTTDSDGLATWTGLNWQQKYWLRETVPAGHTTSLSPNPQLVTLTVPSADGQVTQVDVDNPRTEVSIELTKTDGTDSSALDGGTFQLWRDTDGDDKVGENDVQVGADKPLVAGAVAWTSADTDLPWGYTYLISEAEAPTGYGLMTPNPIVVTTTVADQGTTITRTATDPRLPAGLAMTKVDDFGAAVSGAQFRLYLSDGDGTFDDDVLVAGSQRTTGADGALSWSNLTWGESYYVLESSTPAGYDAMAPNPVLVTIPKTAAGGEHDLTGTPMVDPRQRTSLQIEKVDELDASQKLDATFSLWLDADKDGAVTATDTEVVSGVATGDDGIATFDDLLVWGNQYLLVETHAPAGYGFMTPNPKVVPVDKDDAGTTIELTVQDPRTPAGLQVRKTDAEQQGLPVEGASFRLWQDDGDGTFEGCPVAEVPGQCDTLEQDVRITDDLGLTEPWENLTYGFTYFVQEVAPFPTGYDVMSPNPVSVQLMRGDAGATVTVEVTDPRHRSDLAVTKVDGTSGNEIDGATFQLWEDTNGVDGLQRGGATPDTRRGEETVTDGQATFDDLVVWGHEYWLYESDTGSSDYLPMSPNPLKVKNATEPGDVVDVIELKVEDPRAPSSVTVVKTDDNEDTVPGATFMLYRDVDADGAVSHGDVLVATGTTASTGTVEFTDLVWGLPYLLEETVVPDGYDVMTPSNPRPFTLDHAGNTVLDVTDPRLTVDPSVVKVAAGQDPMPLSGAVFEFWQETNGVDGLQRDGDTPDTDTGKSCTTGDDGSCAVLDVAWGEGEGAAYYWVETQAPAGYNIPTVDWLGPVLITAADATAQHGNEDALAPTVFSDTMTVLTTTPFVGQSEVGATSDDLADASNVARVDEGDVISDRAELTGLSTPAGGDVDFYLFGPFTVDVDGVLTEEISCEADVAFASFDNELTWNAEAGRFEAVSEGLAVGGEGVQALEPGLYQWVADYSGDRDDEARTGKNRGAIGDCPDATEQVLVRGGDEPGVDKTSDPASGSAVQPGTTVTYTVTASNTGDVAIPADEAVVTDTLPAHLTFGQMTSATPAQPEPSVTDNPDGTTTLRWEIGELGAGEDVVLEYTATVSDTAPQGTVLENRAEFLAQFDSTTHVVPTGALTVVKTADPVSGSGVIAGDRITYTLTVTATGGLDQRGVVVSDYVPGSDPALPQSLDTTYVTGSAACSGAGTCTVTGPGADGRITWGLGTLTAGTSRGVTFAVTVDAVSATGSGTVPVGDVVNVAHAASSDTPTVTSNRVTHPGGVVLGVKIGAPQPPAQTKVLGVNLPRTGVEAGIGILAGGLLLLTGAGMVLATRRRRTQDA